MRKALTILFYFSFLFSSSLERQLSIAGTNRMEIERALNQVPEYQRESMEWLITHMPEEDLSIITSEFLTAYPEVEPLYKKLAECLDVDQKQIYLTAGSDAGIKSVFEVYVEPSEEVIIIHPPSFEQVNLPALGELLGPSILRLLVREYLAT